MNFLVKTLFEGFSQFNGQIKVFEVMGTLKLSASGFVQSRSVNSSGESEFYWDALANSTELNNGDRVLLLGMSAGTVALSLRKKFPKITIDGVEIDPLMIELGKKFFALDEAKVNIFIEDAKIFLKKAESNYDLIVLDLFVGDKVPGFVFEKEFAEQLSRILKKTGRVVMNRIYNSKEEIKDFENSFSKSFKIISKKSGPAFASTGNLILVGEVYA